MSPRRPASFPATGAPLVDRSCACPGPNVITTGDGKARCFHCHGIVEAQPQLDLDRGTR